MKYTKKPPVVDAIEFTGDNADEIIDAVKSLYDEAEQAEVVHSIDNTTLLIQTPWRDLRLVPKGCFVLFDGYGFSVLEKSKFEDQYEPV